MIFEFTLISPTKEIKFLNFFLKPKPFQFSNFINHVMIYHDFRFISYVDGSFSIEQKINNTNHYKPLTTQNLTLSERNYVLQKPHVKNILVNVSKQFLMLALARDHKLYMLFKNAQISSLDYSVSIDSENTVYFISLDKTYVVRFFASIFFVYHIPTGNVFATTRLSWQISTNPRMQFDFNPVTQIGEFLPSCHHLKVKQVIFEKNIKNNVVSEQNNISIQFQLNCKRGPCSSIDYCMCFAEHVYMDLYI